MSYAADEAYDVYHEQTLRARKRHRCNACQRDIEPGHYYARIFMIYDGQKDHVKRCGACQKTHLHLRGLCRSVSSDMWPDECLGCGLDYVNEWEREPPPEIACLPLLSDAEAGALLAPAGAL